jgi:prophage regulatory protein
MSATPLPARPEKPAPAFLRTPSVMHMTGLGRSTIYRMMAEQRFPSPVKLSTRAVAWRREDLDRWSEDLKAASH